MPTFAVRLRRALPAAALAAASVCTLAAAPVAPAAAPDRYVALGDSYSSGNGTYAADLNVLCYRSSRAYPYLVARHRPDTRLTFVACHGAKTEDIVNDQAAALDPDTDYVTLTVGGNDIGFAGLIANCLSGTGAGCAAAVAEAERKTAEELPGKLDRAYNAVRGGAPNARKVVVLGYARFFGADVSCRAAGGITPELAARLNRLADDLDVVIRDRATAAGFTYQDPSPAFAGHDVCAARPYLNGVRLSVADGWHPTRAGHKRGLAPLVRQVIG
ncbi:SGNH/GDSL hydrolase family protein [Streptomyces pactum]|uniref:SGNH/GDSL hydrolase family protein n=1 Tax=Streptomyces pactum TaxID=68249 RepID=A0ABS0NE68_9ACTN|nr:SGNH/GDSL hydrolase family protein [Streptomyces pactum]MBH5333461.1 SGNH/GDSL hydrolase family protein [Streptomyces pactum]